MKWIRWIAVPIAVFLGALVLFATMPRSSLIGVLDIAEHSLDSVTTLVRPAADRTGDRADRAAGAARRHSPSGRAGAFRADVSGVARVLDGDTIEIGTVRVRLWGVDAPEGRQECLAQGRPWPCGQQAAQALAERIDGRRVACEERDRDGRIVAVCLHHGQDINAWLVRVGWALAFRRYSKAYVREESEAKSARRGLWRGEFVQPWNWRRGKRLESAGRYTGTVTARDRGDCRIKGNISRNSGRRWYHVPGDPEYEKTRISTSHGERWFCSEAEARAAGWKRTPSRGRVDRKRSSSRETRRASDGDRSRCNIKGNVGRASGTRLYHLPGDPGYAKTRISTKHGERWFCSEAEARAAGWRRAKR
ncbi:MAG: thermonuclease family protein [Rhodospirillales bacterium]|nr:thermonuclease family protein [Rhodospirillales bacterium]